jgi:hypothetical protein
MRSYSQVSNEKAEIQTQCCWTLYAAVCINQPCISVPVYSIPSYSRSLMEDAATAEISRWAVADYFFLPYGQSVLAFQFVHFLLPNPYILRGFVACSTLTARIHNCLFVTLNSWAACNRSFWQYETSILRSQIWQWVRHNVRTAEGRAITPSWVSALLEEEVSFTVWGVCVISLLFSIMWHCFCLSRSLWYVAFWSLCSKHELEQICLPCIGCLVSNKLLRGPKLRCLSRWLQKKLPWASSASAAPSLIWPSVWLPQPSR